MPKSAAIMKHQVCIIMTSLLWVLGQCSSSGVTPTCRHHVDRDILKVRCMVVFTIGKTIDKERKETCEVVAAFLNDTEANPSGNNTFTVEIKAKKGCWHFTVRTTCGLGHRYFDVAHDVEQSGEHDTIDGKSRSPTADPPVHTGAVWAIGAVIVALIFGIVFLMIRRPSNLWMSRRRIPSADMDVERNLDSSSHQDSDCEPLSGGQEPRDSHTPPTTSHKDDVSS